MMYKKELLLWVVSIIFCSVLFAQQVGELNNQKVSLNSNTHVNTAVQILEHFSMAETGKKVINMSSFNSNINVQISDIHWRTALDLIVLRNKLLLEEGAGYFAIKDLVQEVGEETSQELIEKLNLQKDALSKQIRIRAVAVLADRSYVRNLGVDWSTVANGKVSVNAGFAGASQFVSPLTLSASGTTNIGKYTVDINTVINAIESDSKGSILAEPTILVSSGKTGHIQVGQDISIKTADEAGNTMDTFFSTGIILDVTPTLVEVDGEDLIILNLSIERSSGQPSAVSTIITKSTSSTELVLYDGEETVIAGLFDTDEVKTRSGIPILKDLPWWVFGIRYLTGYDSYEKKEREFIITLKAEVVDTALKRARQDRLSKIED
ncbi:MAG: type II and III secretion system protein [Candidatus Cloacimonetes bacterium]|jgi:type IV pilus assembly protein PilQ|nr:type II and III secretion system protein [Candidatus Cloacimonadota bacterium]